jgi:hypothetical protein
MGKRSPTCRYRWYEVGKLGYVVAYQLDVVNLYLTCPSRWAFYLLHYVPYYRYVSTCMRYLGGTAGLRWRYFGSFVGTYLPT